MTRSAETSSAEAMVEAVRALCPLIAEHSSEAEKLRKPVDEVIDKLAATGVFTSYVPKRFGGLEIDPDTFIDVGLAVSEACTSTGWVTTFYMEHNWMLAQFPPETQEEIFGAQPFILAPASISPNGKAQKVDGGYRISGRWGWGTGVMHADWVFLNGIVEGDQPEARLFIVPRQEIDVDDTWYCAGMEGTGSNDIVADAVTIPAARSEPLLDMSSGRGSGAESPCYRHPMLPLLSIAAATPALGTARRALALFTERLGGRVLYGTFTKQAERPGAQVLLGNSSVQVGAAEKLLRNVGREVALWGHEDEVCPPEERARMRLQVAQVVQSCRDVVQNLMQASGAGAHMRSHEMQRILRDINTLSCHTVFDTEIAAENYGRMLLGMDPSSLV